MNAGLLFTVALTPATLVGSRPCAKEVWLLQSWVTCARLAPLISTQVFWEIVAASPVALRTCVIVEPDPGLPTVSVTGTVIAGPLPSGVNVTCPAYIADDSVAAFTLMEHADGVL